MAYKFAQGYTIGGAQSNLNCCGHNPLKVVPGVKYKVDWLLAVYLELPNIKKKNRFRDHFSLCFYAFCAFCQGLTLILPFVRKISQKCKKVDIWTNFFHIHGLFLVVHEQKELCKYL